MPDGDGFSLKKVASEDETGGERYSIDGGPEVAGAGVVKRFPARLYIHSHL